MDVLGGVDRDTSAGPAEGNAFDRRSAARGGLFGHYAHTASPARSDPVDRPASPGPRSARRSDPRPKPPDPHRPLAPRPDDASIAELVWSTFRRPGDAPAPRVTVFFAIDHWWDATLCDAVGEALAAQTAQPVCLVHTDADTALPRPRGYVPLRPLPAEMTAVSGVLPIRTLGPNLWGLSLPRDGGGRAWLTTERATWLMSGLRQCFQWVLVAAGSPRIVAEDLSLARLADGAVLVVAAHRTRRQAALQTKERLERAGVAVLGSVLTGRTFPIPEGLYRRL